MMRGRLSARVPAGGCRRRVVLFGELQRSGELTFEPLGRLDEFLGGGVADHEAGRTEDLGVKHIIGHEVCDVGAKDGGRRRVHGGTFGACPTTLTFPAPRSAAAPEFGEAAMPSVSMVWPARGNGAADGGGQFVACLTGGGEQQAGGGAELTGAAGDGGDVLLGQCVDLFGGAVQRAREDEDRVERGHFRVDRGWARDVRPPCISRPALEPVKQTALMQDRRGLADAAAGAVDQGEHAGVEADVLDGFHDGRPTSSLVPGWALCALKTTGQPAARAEAVSPPAVEKASGKLLAPNTATGPSGIWRWRMSARGRVRSGRAGSIRTPRKSPCRTTLAKSRSWPVVRALALQAGCRQSGFLAGADGQFLADGLDVVRDRVEEGGMGIGIQRAEGFEGLRRGRGCRRAVPR